MRFTGWMLLIVGVLVLTSLFVAGLYYKEVLFSAAIAMSLILTTDKVRLSYRRNRDKVLGERKILYGLGIVTLWGLAIALFILSATQLGQVVTNIETADVSSVEAFVKKATAKLPITTSEQGKIITLIDWIIDYVKDFFVRLGTETEFLLYYEPVVLPIVFLLYYFRNKTIKVVQLFLPRKCREGFVEMLKHTRQRLYDFISAKVLQSAIIGILCCVGFGVAGVEGWFILGLLAGALNIVPYVGPIIGAIPPLLITVVAGDMVQGVYVLATIAGVQLLDNFYLSPVMIADKVSVHPLAAIGLSLLGSHFYGALGLFFAIPVYIAYESLIKKGYELLDDLYGEGFVSLNELH
ncbi:MAG: AI-2E family transporter [Candidatus Nanoarchaeia archaeon]